MVIFVKIFNSQVLVILKGAKIKSLFCTLASLHLRSFKMTQITLESRLSFKCLDWFLFSKSLSKINEINISYCGMDRKRAQFASVSHFEDCINRCWSFSKVQRDLFRNFFWWDVAFQNRFTWFCDLELIGVKWMTWNKLLTISVFHVNWEHT